MYPAGQTDIGDAIKGVIMAYEELFEPIEVITHFKSGQIIPLRFLWNGRAYPVRRLHSSWKELFGTTRQIHFSVQSDSNDCFELLFDTGDFTWQLARVYLDG